MGSLFTALYIKTADDEGCDGDDGDGCNFFKTVPGKGTVRTDYSVQQKFEAIFEFGIITYFADAIFRFIVVLGLKYN